MSFQLVGIVLVSAMMVLFLTEYKGLFHKIKVEKDVKID